MTPAELTAGRRQLRLTAAGFGRALELEGRDPGRMVRHWETGTHRVPGPVAVALRLMLEAQARQSLQEATERAQAILTPPPHVIGPVEHLEAAREAAKSRTRRRG